MTGLQNVGVVNALEALQPTDFSVESPTFDPSTLNVVYGLDPIWMGCVPVRTFDTQSINGALMTVDDQDASVDDAAWDAYRLPSRWRTWYVGLQATGGAVTPINVNISWLGAGGARLLASVEVDNPSQVTVGPIIGPPGFPVRVATANNGGVGDDFYVTLSGLTGAAGVGVPMLPSFTTVVNP